MQRLFRTLLRTMALAAMLLTTGCTERMTSPPDPGLASYSVLAGGAVGELSTGGYHACVVKTDGSVVCWGRNSSGQATPPPGLIAIQVSAGQTHTCARRADGTVTCWGDNSWGELNVPAGLVASQVGAGTYNSCALRTDATVVCWGGNQSGISTVPGGLTSVAAIIPTLEHTCALKTDGTVVCWGHFYDEGNPPGLIATQVSGRWNYTCALKSDGTIGCWGYDPYEIVPAGTVATQITAGGGQTCALRADATVACWGLNDQGQANVPAGLTSVAHVSAGYLHTCALKTDGTVVCWGRNLEGQANVPAGLNLIVTQPQVITFTSSPPGAAFVGASYRVTATGGASGSPVTFTSLTSTVCGVSGNTTEFLAAGTCSIAANQAGNANYFAAPQVTQSMTVVERNVAPVVTEIMLPVNPVSIGSSVAVAASFTDGNASDLHSAAVDWDDADVTAGAVSESSGAGAVAASHSYGEAGVYTVGVSVSDGDLTGARSSELDVPAYVVVYDPAAGFVTGGGWITSPQGAYPDAPALTGKASFGFVSRYKKGAATPSGNTEFQFQAATFNFSGSTYQWLVIAGAKAQFKGTGAVNGGGTYEFLLSAVDGQTNGGGGTDRFRIKIWETATGTVVYDNQMGGSEDSNATTELGGGSIVIHP